MDKATQGRHAGRSRLTLAALGLTVLAFQRAPDPTGMPDLSRLPVIVQLPDPFLMNDGKRVATREDWLRRREQIQTLLLHYQYGHLAPAPSNIAAHEQASRKVDELKAVEKQLLLTLGPGDAVSYNLILTVPEGKGLFPVIVKGDLCWGRVATPILEDALGRGYAVAEFNRTDIAPDKDDRSAGVHSLYPQYDWSTLAAWAWGFHRTVDYLLTLDWVDRNRIAVTGHSRGGKAALLAGALDERIALTAPNGSGCGGAGCYRILGEKSEDIGAITNRFPYWFHPRFRGFIGHVNQMPFDQHFLKALVAPRAQLSTEGLGDLWANPLGTQTTYLAAKQVYEFLGAGGRIGIHFREGKHAHNEADWKALLDFADRQFFDKQVPTRFDALAFPEQVGAFAWSAP